MASCFTGRLDRRGCCLAQSRERRYDTAHSEHPSYKGGGCALTNSWRGSLLLLFFTLHTVLILDWSLIKPQGGGAGWAGALVWWFHGYEHGKWQMESTGEVFHLPNTITWHADTCLFEIPDRLIAVFHTADRFNSLLCSFWQCTCIITHYTNKAEKRWPEKSFLICNEGNIFTA